MLEQGIDLVDTNGNRVHFGEYVLKKYLHGVGRKNGASDVRRLLQLPQAILCIEKHSEGINLHPGDNPPQRSYLHKLSSKRNMIVFTNAETGEVRSFMRAKTNQTKAKHERGGQ